MKTFFEIPASSPSTPLLDKVNYPSDLRKLTKKELRQLSDELREFLIYSVSQSGGHFGAGLGVIELTVALHYIFNTPEDNLIWDSWRKYAAVAYYIVIVVSSSLLCRRGRQGLQHAVRGNRA